jgi:hypothetical protein
MPPQEHLWALTQDYTHIMSHPRSALPPLYYAIFGIYEPILTTMGFIGALLDPIKARIGSLNNDATLRMILFFWDLV